MQYLLFIYFTVVLISHFKAQFYSTSCLENYKQPQTLQVLMLL